MTLTVGSIVSPPNGSWPIGSEDSYDPQNDQLTVPAVEVGTTTRYNVVGTVASLGSIGSVAGADTFDGTHLHIPYVLLGSSPFYNVVLDVSLQNVVAVHGGMPDVTWDEYSAIPSGQLTIPGVLAGTKVYTNVVLSVGLGNVVSARHLEFGMHTLGSSGDGMLPYDSLIQASDGNLYGMTSLGGANARGTLIKVTPAGLESVLYYCSARLPVMASIPMAA